MVDFDTLGILNPDPLPPGWQIEPDAAHLLMESVVQIVHKQDENILLSYVRVASELEEAGNDDWSRFVLQAVLVNLSGRELTKDPETHNLLLKEEHYRTMLDEVLASVPTSRLLPACVLTVAGRVAKAERDFAYAVALLSGAALEWKTLQNDAEVEQTLFHLGAALSYAGEFIEAQRVNEELDALFAARGNEVGRLMLRLNAIQNLYSTGDIRTAEKELERIESRIQAIRNGHLKTSYHLNKALILVEQNEFAHARKEFVLAEQNARRRNDLPQLLVAQKNIAKITSEEVSLRRGIAWWQKARDTARALHNRREEQDLEHALGVRLAEIEDFGLAVSAFDRSISVSQQFGDSLATARARSDLGAVTLSWATYSREAGSTDESRERLESAEETLLQAKTDLEQLQDFSWAEIAVRNLRSVWSLGDHPELGVKILTSDASRFGTIEPDYASELLRNAGLLALSDVPNIASQTAIEWLKTAIGLRGLEDDKRAWSIAHDASYVEHRLQLPAEAAKLFDISLSFLDVDEDPTSWGNIQNDAALAAARSNDLNDAAARLSSVVEIAESTHNRVLGALALGNLAEVTSRQNNGPEARTLFERAALYAEAIGDLDRASQSWSSIANLWTLEDELSNAVSAQERAVGLGVGIPSALTRARSAQASILFAQGNFASAREIWTELALVGSSAHVGEYYAFALDCLAHEGNWTQFRQKLDTWGGKLQRARSTAEFVDKMHATVHTWLLAGNAGAAGVVLAYLALLTVDSMSRSQTDGGASGARLRSRAITEQLKDLAIVRAYLSDYDHSEQQRRVMRRAYERVIFRLVKEDAIGFIKMVDDLFDEFEDEVEK